MNLVGLRALTFLYILLMLHCLPDAFYFCLWLLLTCVTSLSSQMWAIATDVLVWYVLSLCVSVLSITVSTAKVAKLINIPFEGQTVMGKRNHISVQGEYILLVQGRYRHHLVNMVEWCVLSGDQGCHCHYCSILATYFLLLCVCNFLFVLFLFTLVEHRCMHSLKINLIVISWTQSCRNLVSCIGVLVTIKWI